jgi:cation diffusion facilitator family transporter
MERPMEGGNELLDERLTEGHRATAASLALNIVLAILKLVAGVIGNSYALVADAIESLGDIFLSSIVRAGMVIASRPADANHPYGHGKAEPLAALAVAVMLLASVVFIAVQSIYEIRTPHERPASYTLVVLLAVVVFKEAFYQYGSRVARRIRSTAVAVEAWHHRSDALTSIAAAVGITIALVGGPGFAQADDWAALVACAVILFNGARFARFAVHELMDTVPATSLEEGIHDVV